MTIFIDLVFRFIFFVIITWLLFGVYLVISFCKTPIKKRTNQNQKPFISFVKSKLRRKKLRVMVLFLPVCLTLIVFGFFTVSAYSRTNILRSELQNATMMKVTTVDYENVHSMKSIEKQWFGKAIFKTADQNQIKDVVRRIFFMPTMTKGRCACRGDFLFEFYEGDKILRAFSYHHRRHIRVYGLFDTDLRLSPGSRYLLDSWLDQKDSD